MPTLETIDVSNTRTGNKQQFSPTLPDLQVKAKVLLIYMHRKLRQINR